MWKNNNGFTLVELLISIVMVGIMMASVATTFTAQSKASIQQDRHLEMEDNLRVAMHFVTDAIRNAGYGVPRTSLSTWLSSEYGTTTVPLIWNASNYIAFASCGTTPVATVASNASLGATSLTVDTSASISAGDTIWIGWAEFAKVTSTTSNTVSFDTNPVSMAGSQGLYRLVYSGTPICRVTTKKFTVNGSTMKLTYDPGDGSAAQVLAENIDYMALVQLTERRRYRLTLRGKMTDPKTNTTVTQQINSDVVFVN
jgi:prepilin-type N-terminal cleavage/methylation domain-containing protein